MRICGRGRNIWLKVKASIFGVGPNCASAYAHAENNRQDRRI